MFKYVQTCQNVFKLGKKKIQSETIPSFFLEVKSELKHV